MPVGDLFVLVVGLELGSMDKNTRHGTFGATFRLASYGGCARYKSAGGGVFKTALYA